MKSVRRRIKEERDAALDAVDDLLPEVLATVVFGESERKVALCAPEWTGVAVIGTHGPAGWRWGAARVRRPEAKPADLTAADFIPASPPTSLRKALEARRRLGGDDS